jgi:hypothetical protein
MKMKDMKKKAMKGGEYDMVSCPTMGNEDEYPYGLEIRLGNEEIEKLGIDVYGVSVGDEVALMAKATVKEVNEREMMKDGETMTDKNCTFQITELAIHQEPEKGNSVKDVLKMAKEY